MQHIQKNVEVDKGRGNRISIDLYVKCDIKNQNQRRKTQKTGKDIANMKRENLRFKHDTEHINDTFLKSCLFNPIIKQDESEDYFNFLKNTLKNSTTTEEFTDAFLSNKRFRKMQGYQELLKRERPERIWSFIRENFGERCFKTESDIGSVKVGTDDFSIALTNGQGDGITRVAVFDNSEDFYCENVMNFNTIITGHFSIYDYDCGGKPIKELTGRYGIYFYQGQVAFVKM